MAIDGYVLDRARDCAARTEDGEAAYWLRHLADAWETEWERAVEVEEKLAAEREKNALLSASWGRAEAVCAELRKAVYEAIEWNWLDEESGPPADVQESIKHALSADDGRAYAERMERYRQALQQSHEHVCALLCPVQWKTDDGYPGHHDLCIEVGALLGKKPDSYTYCEAL